MTFTLKCSLPLVVLAWCAAACSGGSSGFPLPTGPSATPRPAPPPAPVSPNAIPVVLGETVAGVVTEADPRIDTAWGSEPAVRFKVETPTAGTLTVHLASAGPTGLTLWVNSAPFWGTVTDAAASVRVLPGAQYEIAVSIHDQRSASQSFELTTAVHPQ
jgi:hypothetical protein